MYAQRFIARHNNTEIKIKSTDEPNDELIKLNRSGTRQTELTVYADKKSVRFDSVRRPLACVHQEWGYWSEIHGSIAGIRLQYIAKGMTHAANVFYKIPSHDIITNGKILTPFVYIMIGHIFILHHGLNITHSQKRTLYVL